MSSSDGGVPTWVKALIVVLVMGVLIGGAVVSYVYHERYVETPKAVIDRHDEPVGTTGPASFNVIRQGGDSIPTLLLDLENANAKDRAKSVELLSSIKDPRVPEGLLGALRDKDLGVKLTAVTGIVRHTQLTARDEVAGVRAKFALALWEASRSTSDPLRRQAIVGLGFVVDKADIEPLLAQVAERNGHDRTLFAWAAGHAARRAEAAASGRLPEPARLPQSDEDEAAIQQEVASLLERIDLGQDLLLSSRRLSELTDVDQTLVPLAHLVQVQVIAVKGPRAYRGSEAESLMPARPSGVAPRLPGSALAPHKAATPAARPAPKER